MASTVRRRPAWAPLASSALAPTPCCFAIHPGWLALVVAPLAAELACAALAEHACEQSLRAHARTQARSAEADPMRRRRVCISITVPFGTRRSVGCSCECEYTTPALDAGHAWSSAVTFANLRDRERTKDYSAERAKVRPSAPCAAGSAETDLGDAPQTLA